MSRPADAVAPQQPGPSFQAWLPVRLGAWPMDAESPARLESNLRMLRVIATLETREAEPGDDDPLAQEFARLHDKVDLMLEMMAGLYERAGVVASRSLQIGWRQATFADSSATCRVGDHVLLELWLHPLVARPFALSAEVVDRQAQDGGNLLTLELEVLTGELGAAWERYVFRQHRREVSRDRSTQQIIRPHQGNK